MNFIMKNYYAKQNQFGHWVGYIVYKDGAALAITNAQLTEHKALAIAERISARAAIAKATGGVK